MAQKLLQKEIIFEAKILKRRNQRQTGKPLRLWSRQKTE